MKISSYIDTDNIFIEDSFETTDELYLNFTKKLKERGVIFDADRVKRLFIKRENVQSTAIGNFTATPHIFSEEFDKFQIFTVFLKKPLEFRAPDNKPVKIVFLIVSNDRDVSLHLKSLAGIAKIALNEEFTDMLNKVNTAEEVKNIIDKTDTEQ